MKRLLVASFLVALFALPGCKEEAPPAKKVVKPKPVQTAVVYSCDNQSFGNGAPCYPPGDAKHMTVAFKGRPAGSTIARLKDEGQGIKVTILKSKNYHGDKWYEVKTEEGRTGWVGYHLIDVDKRN